MYSNPLTQDEMVYLTGLLLAVQVRNDSNFSSNALAIAKLDKGSALLKLHDIAISRVTTPDPILLKEINNFFPELETTVELAIEEKNNRSTWNKVSQIRTKNDEQKVLFKNKKQNFENHCSNQDQISNKYDTYIRIDTDHDQVEIICARNGANSAQTTRFIINEHGKIMYADLNHVNNDDMIEYKYNADNKLKSEVIFF